MSTAPGRPQKEEESAIFPIPIAVSPEARAILERLDRSVRGAQESPEPAAKPPPDQVIRECEVRHVTADRYPNTSRDPHVRVRAGQCP